MCICIIDYGMGNLRSVWKAIEKTGYEAKLISTAQEIYDAKALVLPGVGAFKKCFQNLETQGLITPILRSIAAGKPFLGICLGLQILFSGSEEFGSTPGLDIIKGRVRHFPSEMKEGDMEKQLKIPHMGWNRIKTRKTVPCLDNIQDEAFLYFVHSYYVEPDNLDIAATTTEYGIEFVSSIWKDNIFACQFHPEKSQAVGLQILKNFGALSTR